MQLVVSTINYTGTKKCLGSHYHIFTYFDSLNTNLNSEKLHHPPVLSKSLKKFQIPENCQDLQFHFGNRYTILLLWPWSPYIRQAGWEPCEILRATLDSCIAFFFIVFITALFSEKIAGTQQHIIPTSVLLLFCFLYTERKSLLK